LRDLLFTRYSSS